MVRRRLGNGIVVLAVLVTASCQPFPFPSPSLSSLGEDPSGALVQPAPDDRTLVQTVRTRLMETDRNGFQGVSVLAWRGTVLLTGAVVRPGLRLRAQQVAESVGGVSRVWVDLQLIEAPLLADFAPDTARERTLLARLATMPGQYDLRVVHGVVYLLGSASRRAEADRAADLLREADGVKWVVDHTVAENEG